jgi:hypothetical protein
MVEVRNRKQVSPRFSGNELSPGKLLEGRQVGMCRYNPIGGNGNIQRYTMTDNPAQGDLFRVSNRHSPEAGKPPHIDADTRGRYHGYFENEHGEKVVFVYDYETKTGTHWMGDAGWEQGYNVVDGLVPALIMSEQEEMWLQACWNAATAFDRK